MSFSRDIYDSTNRNSQLEWTFKRTYHASSMERPDCFVQLTPDVQEMALYLSYREFEAVITADRPGESSRCIILHQYINGASFQVTRVAILDAFQVLCSTAARSPRLHINSVSFS